MSVPAEPPTPARALALYAHPDDPDISCGGTLARWALDGCAVHVVICAAGDKGSSDPERDPAELVKTRIAEAERSAEVLGVVGLHLLGHPDGEFENDQVLRGELVRIIRQVCPEAMVCPDPTAVFFGEHHYNHRDHRVVGWAALDAAAPAAASPLYFRDEGPAHQVEVAYLTGSLESNVWVDVDATLDRKIDAVRCHASQLGDGGDWISDALRDGAANTGRDAGLRHAEAFRRVWLAS